MLSRMQLRWFGLDRHTDQDSEGGGGCARKTQEKKKEEELIADFLWRLVSSGHNKEHLDEYLEK